MVRKVRGEPSEEVNGKGGEEFCRCVHWECSRYNYR